MFGVFGSLGRGNWDIYSDLDLDVIVTDDSEAVINQEMKDIFSEFQKQKLNILLQFQEVANEWIIIFKTLDRVSIRFHLIENTVPHILSTLKILLGTINLSDIRRVIKKNETGHNDLKLLKNKFIELSIYVPIAIKRGNFSNAIFFLNKMRNIIIEIYTLSKGIPRLLDFEKSAEPKIMQELSKTYPAFQPDSVRQSFLELVNLFIHSINSYSDNLIELNGKEILILTKSIELLV